MFVKTIKIKIKKIKKKKGTSFPVNVLRFKHIFRCKLRKSDVLSE